MGENTKKDFPFTIEGQSFDSPDEKLTAKSIIGYAKKKGIRDAQSQIENLTLKGEKGTVYSGDDWVDLSQYNKFSLGIKETQVYKFMVNGQELESNKEKLKASDIKASDIIEMAQREGVAAPGKPENWRLEEIGGKVFETGDDVDLSQFKEFLLIPSGATQVAVGDLQCRA